MGFGFLAFAETEAEIPGQKYDQGKGKPVEVAQVAQNNFGINQQIGVGQMTAQEQNEALDGFRKATKEDLGGEEYDFDPGVTIPKEVQDMSNSDLEDALNNAEKEAGMVPTDKNKERLNQLKKRTLGPFAVGADDQRKKCDDAPVRHDNQHHPERLCYRWKPKRLFQ